MKNVFNRIKKLFSKDADANLPASASNVPDYMDGYLSPSSFLMVRKHDSIIIPDIDVRNNVGKNAPTILIMDDYSGMVDLLYTEILRIQCCDTASKFNILTSTDEYAAFTVKEYIENGGKIDIAFLDITIGGIKDGVELDGIDTALMIKESNPNSVVKFITGHTLNKRNPEIFEFMNKFYQQTGMHIDEEENVKDFKSGDDITIRKHIIGKNSNRVMLMAIAIEQWLISAGKMDKDTGKCLL